MISLSLLVLSSLAPDLSEALLKPDVYVAGQAFELPGRCQILVDKPESVSLSCNSEGKIYIVRFLAPGDVEKEFPEQKLTRKNNTEGSNGAHVVLHEKNQTNDLVYYMMTARLPHDVFPGHEYFHMLRLCNTVACMSVSTVDESIIEDISRQAGIATGMHE